MADKVYAKANTLTSVRETQLLGKEQWDSLLRSGSLSDARRLLRDWGYLSGDTGGSTAREIVAAKEEELFAWAGQITPVEGVLSLFTAAKDANNLKVLFREELDSSGESELWLEGGSLDRAGLCEGDCRKLLDDFSADWEQHGSWQRINLMAEHFRLSLLKKNAELLGEPEVETFVSDIIDLYNLSVFVQNSGENPLPLRLSFAEGGTIGKAEWVAAAENGDTSYPARTPYGAVWESREDFDSARDNFLMEKVRAAKMMPFGLLPFLAYLFAAVMELKNLRMVITALENGLSTDLVRRRLRILYEI
ncbi:MAG: V-type ATPase subunit [Oscillospiraceae bacterium]